MDKLFPFPSEAKTLAIVIARSNNGMDVPPLLHSFYFYAVSTSSYVVPTQDVIVLLSAALNGLICEDNPQEVA